MKNILLGIMLLFSGSIIGQTNLADLHPDFYYNQAMGHYRSGDYQVARHLLDEYLRLEETPEALYYRAVCSIKSGDTAGPYYVRSFIATYPLHPLAHKAQFELAHQYFAQQNYQRAVLTYAGMDPMSLDKKQREQAYFEKGYAMVQINIGFQGVESFQNAYALDGPYKYPSAYYLGTLTEGEEAEKWLLEALNDSDWEMKAAVYLSQLYLLSEDYTKLQEVNQSLMSTEKSVENSNLHFYTGESYYQEAQYRTAARYFSDGIALGVREPDAETLFKLGHAYYESGDLISAAEQLQRSGLNESKTGQASAFQLGKIYVELDQYANALHAYQIAASSDHDAEMTEEASFLSAKINVELTQYEQGIIGLESFIDTYPTSTFKTEANELLSTAYLYTSNYDLIVQHFEQIPNPSRLLQANYQEVTLLKALQLFSDRQPEEALVMLDKSIVYPVSSSYESDAYFWIGECHSLLGNTGRSRSAYRKVITLTPDAPMPEYGLGYLAYNEKQYEEARTRFINFLRKADTDHPVWQDARLRRADCEYALKNYDEALGIYESLIATGVAQDYVFFQIGLIHQLNARTEEAVASYEQVIASTSSSYRDNAMFQKAQAYFENAAFESSNNSFTNYIEAYADESAIPYAYIRRGLGNFNLENNEEAKTDYLFVLDNHMAHPAAESALLGIQELERRGLAIDFDYYLDAYKRANPEATSVSTIEFEQAKNLYFSERYTEAIDKFTAILALNPDSPFKEDILFYLGDSNDRLGASDAALSYYDQVLAMNSSQYLNRVLDKRGRLLISLGRNEDAIGNYQRLLSISNSRKDTYLAQEGLMKAHFSLENYGDAVVNGRAIVAGEWKPSNAENEAYLFIGKSLSAQGNQVGAIDEYVKIINAGTDELAAEAKYLIGEIQHGQGQYNASLETLFQLNARFGSYQYWVGESFLLMGQNYMAKEDYMQAKATFESLVESFPDDQVKSRAQAQLVAIDEVINAQINQDTIR